VTGLSAIIDRGPDLGGWMTVRGTEDFLAVANAFLDYAKIYAAHSLMLPADWVREKVALYGRYDVVLGRHLHGDRLPSAADGRVL
jgi:hypothetical protein